jgi:hypothetical protein
MAVRYIYNTSGDYVAFVSNGYLFSPNAEWLGVIKRGNQVYLKNGNFLGYLLNDDRIARKKDELPKLPILQPLMPLKPLPPLRPLLRLAKPALLYPYEDVFENKSVAPATTRRRTVRSFEDFIDAFIIAHDGTNLGKISKNAYDVQSLSNPYGMYGNKYSAKSLLNQYGQYGNPYSPKSPFNQYTRTPPQILKNGVRLAFLTKNSNIQGAIDPDDLFLWLGIK